MRTFQLQPVEIIDKDWITGLLENYWGSTKVVSRSVVYEATGLPDFSVKIDNSSTGLITYNVDESGCQIVTLNSLREGIGIGTALIEAVKTDSGNTLVFPGNADSF